MRIIGYERVSTARQGASGLGIAAQRQAIEGFAAQRNADLIARFTEVESGAILLRGTAPDRFSRASSGPTCLRSQTASHA